MPNPDTCRRHPEAPAVAQCLKHGHGICTACLEDEPRCWDPDLYCKFRPQCLIHFQEKELARASRATTPAHVLGELSMSPDSPYADFIQALPQADLPMAGITASLLAGPHGQAVFFELPAGTVVPPHSHGAQWGIIVKGELELTIAGVKHTFRQGDSYFVGHGVEHSAVIDKPCWAIDIFADPRRYSPKPGARP
jgi:quercetin dioxygenase-like cupin family protein